MAILKNVRVSVRLSALERLLHYKGSLNLRPGREATAQKVVVDSPIMELPELEYNQRKGDLAKVIQRGWQLVETEPCEVWIGDIAISAANVVSFSGKVESNNVATTCGFEIDQSPEFTSSLALTADESPVTSVDREIITQTADLALYEGITFYVRAYATDGVKTVYSIVKSIEIPYIYV